MKRKIILFLFVLFFINNLLFAGDVDANESKIPPLVKIADSKYRFGEVIIDQKKRTLEFNATTNQKNGLIEYVLVHESGKVHESLFRTKVRPQIMHACLLLLKLPVESRFFENLWAEKPQKLNFEKSKIKIEVFWEQNGTSFSKAIETFAINSQRDAVLREGVFIFTGSKKIEGTYLADVSGSMIAVYADEESVINSSDHDSNNDDVWLANGKEMPELEVEVGLRFHLP